MAAGNAYNVHQEELKTMKGAWVRGAILFLAFVAQTLFVVGQPAAQEDYPVPPGNPETWGIPGHVEKLPIKPQPGSPDMFSAPTPAGNEQQNQPSAPAGEADEKYTGTRGDFGGIAGTGIGQTGTPENR